MGGEPSEGSGSEAGPNLLLGKSRVDVSSFLNVLALIDGICVRASASGARGAARLDAPATTTMVQNFIDRHVGPGDSLLLFTSSDIKLEARVLSQMQAQRSTIHVHINDDTMSRMEREKARIGDVTVTLVWDDWNDLDLHVITPQGNEIYYGNREADGGMLDVDMNAGWACSKEPIENVFFGDAERGIEAMKGKYSVVVQNFAYHHRDHHLHHRVHDDELRSRPVPFRVLVRKNGEVSEYQGETAAGKTGAESDVKVVDFEYHGRTVVLPSEAPSAMEGSNLVAVTASVGSTLDALGALMRLGEEIAEIERTRALVQEDGDMDTPEAGSNLPAAAAGRGPDDAAATSREDGALLQQDMVGDNVMQTSRQAEIPEGRQPVLASRSRFEVTSRDRLMLQLAQLPQRFHQMVAGAFGGPSLLELTCRQLATRLHESNTPPSELRQKGYPEHIVEMVKRLIATKGASAK